MYGKVLFPIKSVIKGGYSADYNQGSKSNEAIQLTEKYLNNNMTTMKRNIH
uniref:Uncharacterized protein n=1 Tax=Anguilla anguilla TaxID=7936 RepID=A0A0E9V0X5_ANGAN